MRALSFRGQSGFKCTHIFQRFTCHNCRMKVRTIKFEHMHIHSKSIPSHLFLVQCFAVALIFLQMANVSLASGHLLASLFWRISVLKLFFKFSFSCQRSFLRLSLCLSDLSLTQTQPRYCSPFVLTCELDFLHHHQVLFQLFFSHPVCFFTICSDLWTGLSWSPLRPSAYPQYKAKRRCCRSPIKDSKIDFSDDWSGARKDSEIDMSDGWPGRQWPRWRHPDREWEKAPAKSDQHK